MWAAAGVDRAVREVQHISAQRDAWVEAGYQLSQEHSIGHAYLAGPTPKLRAALDEAKRSADAALRFLADHGERDDAAGARRIQARHAPGFRLLREGFQEPWLERPVDQPADQAAAGPEAPAPGRPVSGP